MSALSEKVRVALYTKLNVSGVTSLATGGVYHLLAPETAAKPYLTFNRQGAAPVTRAFESNLIAEEDLWVIKAVADEDSSTTKEPQQLAEEILQAAETAIGTSLSLAGGSVTWGVERFADVPEYTETVNDRLVYHHGFILRVVSH